MPPSEDDPFATTVEYYADYRPGYGERAIEYLVDRFELDGSARVLDLGCGTGQLAIPLSAHAGEVVGMDPDEAMLRAARERAAAAGRENVEWVVGSDADLDPGMGPFRLTTMGRSFHWMEGERTLERLSRATEPGGGVALLNDAEWFTRGTRDWEATVYGVAAEYVDDLPPRTGPVEYDDPWDELVAACGFEDVDTVTFDLEREWTVEAVVGYVLSLSFCSPDRLGDDRDDFEREVRARLPEGPFEHVVDLEVIAGRTGTEGAGDSGGE